MSKSEPYRHVPYNIEVEQALLGAILQDNQALERSTAILKPEQFYDPLHARIFETMSQMIERGGVVVTPLTLHATMKADPGVMELGGQSYFDELRKAAPAIPNIRDLANIIADLAVRRRLIEVAETITINAYEPLLDLPTHVQIEVADEALRIVREGCASTQEQTPILNSADFVADFVSPDYVLDGILQRGFLYSLTAPTGAGKTALLLRLMAHVALARPFGGREVCKGRTLMLVGENADDVRARWIALLEHLDILPCEINVHFMPGVFSIPANFARIRAQAQAVGGYSLIGVDTSAAYFDGDEENSNKQLGDHARTLRTLTKLPGFPCVVSPCHPTKGAADDNLLPRGGGAFIAEVDGNLTANKKFGSIELHWQGKFRGPDFQPLAFELLTVTSHRLINSKGRLVPSVIAVPISDVEQTQRAEAADADLRRLLAVMAQTPGVSMSTLAEQAGWFAPPGSNMPAKSKVQRLIADLKKQKLVTKELNKWVLTTTGTSAAKRAQE